MEWREGRVEGLTVVIILVMAVCLGLALPAKAHGGAHPVVIASEQEVGPFLVTAWTTDEVSTGEVPIAVDLMGEYVESEIEVAVHASGSGLAQQSVVLTPATWLGSGVWAGTVTVESDGRHEIVIEVTHPDGRFSTAPLLMTVSMAGGVWGVVLTVVLLASALQALAFLGWILMRTPRLWRQVRRQGDLIALAKGAN